MAPALAVALTAAEPGLALAEPPTKAATSTAAPLAPAATPVTGSTPATASLGADLRAIGAFADLPDVVDPRLVPPPPVDTLWPRVLVGSGAAMVAIGALGMLISPGCVTRDRADRCLDPRGSHPAWPAMIVVGLGGTVTGSYWYRRLRLGADGAE